MRLSDDDEVDIGGDCGDTDDYDAGGDDMMMVMMI